MVEVKSPFVTGCIKETGSLKLVHANDYSEPFKCANNDESRSILKTGSTGKIFINRSVYHTQYVGISFAGAFTMASFPGRLWKSIGDEPLSTYAVRDKDGKVLNKTNKGDTIVRLIFYPNLSSQGAQSASLFFYDLVVYRDKPSDELQEEAEKARYEKTHGNVLATTDSVNAEIEEEKEELKEEKAGVFNKISNNPEDIYFTSEVFGGILNYLKNPPEIIREINNECNIKGSTKEQCNKVLDKERRVFSTEYANAPIYKKMNLYYGLTHNILTVPRPPKKTPVGKDILTADKLFKFREDNKLEEAIDVQKTQDQNAEMALEENKDEIKADAQVLSDLKTQLSEVAVEDPDGKAAALQNEIEEKDKEIAEKKKAMQDLKQIEKTSEATIEQLTAEKTILEASLGNEAPAPTIQAAGKTRKRLNKKRKTKRAKKYAKPKKRTRRQGKPKKRTRARKTYFYKRSN